MRPSEPASIATIPGLGEMFAGAYRVERVLGRGAMGMVVSAEHVPLRRRVAVKFLLPQVMRMSWASTRFLREARAAAAIQSEHVAKVIDVGVSESGLPYIVMEHLAGYDIQQVLDSRGPLPIKEAVGYLLQACEAIAKAHAIGIVHRDLKPGNMFLVAAPDSIPLVKVLDFGLSKALGTDATINDGKVTSAGVLLGSPCYMSPEQVRSAKDVDARTDVWSLGVILYQLLTTRFPFEAPTLSALFAAIAADPPTPPRTYRPDLPAGLEAIILRCLEKDVKRRVQSVAELMHALVPFAARAPRWAKKVGRAARRRGAPSPSSRRTVRRWPEVDPQGATIAGAQAERYPRRTPCADEGPTLVSKGVDMLGRGDPRPALKPVLLRADDGPTLVSALPREAAEAAPAELPRWSSRTSRPPRRNSVPPKDSGPEAAKATRSDPAAISSAVVHKRRSAAALIAVAVALITVSALAATLWQRSDAPLRALRLPTARHRIIYVAPTATPSAVRAVLPATHAAASATSTGVPSILARGGSTLNTHVSRLPEPVLPTSKDQEVSAKEGGEINPTR